MAPKSIGVVVPEIFTRWRFAHTSNIGLSGGMNATSIPIARRANLCLPRPRMSVPIRRTIWVLLPILPVMAVAGPAAAQGLQGRKGYEDHGLSR